jgi:signal transduction histidine kinase/DNA-binding NarL/FixJ family response regulator
MTKMSLATSVTTQVAAAVARARNLPELGWRLAVALGTDETEPGFLRLWRVAGANKPKELICQPSRPKRGSTPTSVIAAAAAEGKPVVRGGLLLIPLRDDEGILGVLELGARGALEEDALVEAAAVIAAGLRRLLDSNVGAWPADLHPVGEGMTDAQRVVSRFAAQAQRLLDHDRLSVYLLTPDGASLERFAVATSPIVPGEGEVFPLEDAGIACVIRTQRSVVSADLATDERIRGREDALIAHAGFHGLLSVPLRIDGQPIGILNFVSRVLGFYTDDDVPLAQQMADQVAVFFQNLRLEHSVRQAIERESIQLERARLAREFHDTLAQSLSGLVLKSAALVLMLDTNESGQAALAVELHQRSLQALEESRRAISNLFVAELELQPLEATIRGLLERIRRDCDAEVQLDIQGDLAGLPQVVQVALLRIVQEAAANVRRHSAASRIAVSIKVGADLLVSVQDNGRGFANDALAEHGFGRRVMRERAESIGGRLIVTSTRGKGTTVVATIPLEEDAPKREGRGPDPVSAPGRVIRALVVDDHPLVRECLVGVLEREKDIRVVGQASTGAEAVATARHCRPDIVILDWKLPDLTGQEVTEALLRIPKRPKVLILSAFADRSHVLSVMAAGADGFVLKSVELPALRAAIRSVLEGSTVIDCANAPRPWMDGDGKQLSLRDLQVLQLVAAGYTTVEIANSVYLSVKSVERIIAAATAKLGAKNRTQAVACAIGQGLIEAPL